MTLPFWGPDPTGAPDDVPARPAPGTTRPAPPAPRRLSLVRLSGEIARSLSLIGRVAVEGEVYRPQTSRAGWVFFTLRDRAAQLPVVCPARHTRRCRTVNGERVLVVGTLVWGNDRGQLQLEAEEVTPVGEGAMAALIAEVRARLSAEGLVDRPRRPLPRLPRVIGVLCGTDAAVRKDIESVVAARFAGYPLAVEETTVSGPGAALSILEALGRLAGRPAVDVIVLARGGGDATSLLPWSDEDLCRAVAACPVPVVSAIGHEADRPLCDEVADLRCGTPSIAAHAVVPDRKAIEAELAGALSRAAAALGSQRDQVRHRLARAEVSGALAAGLERARNRLGHAGDRLGWAHPAPLARASRQRLSACDWSRPFAAQMATGHQRLAALHRHAWSLSPQHVVERGFAVARRADGTIVRGPDEVEPGGAITVTVARGVIAATVGPRGRP
jgi:exodeoxyribonuclease VII large subunit